MKRQDTSPAARRRRALIGGEEGVVLPSVLMLIAVLAVVGATSMTAAVTDLRIARAYYKSVAVFHIAEAGLVHGRHEVSDEDGDRDFSAIATHTMLFSEQRFHGGSYTVVATPVTGATPARLRLRSSACYPAADPCPRSNARAALEALLEYDPGGATPQDRVRLIAWRSLD
ncbi:MAG: pilus assembly PilX N-terminal domain-containing protein [Deltaproteobacteria bacterium]|nr:pilus assembly PilX N-terminal domain-containing protein [Deltaproteobacteria bacterium]